MCVPSTPNPPLHTQHQPPHTRSVSKDFKTIEAEKDARTPTQADWLSRAAKIPVKHA